MSLTWDRGQVVFECDNCGDTLETEESEFDLALERAKENGWGAHRMGRARVWRHYCGEKCFQEASDNEES